ncbi:MAG: hypothetical protein MJ136_05460 [Clostridia bacterium]|nr:hypothetical protein [Clostridia bacterium]
MKGRLLFALAFCALILLGVHALPKTGEIKAPLMLRTASRCAPAAALPESSPEPTAMEVRSAVPATAPYRSAACAVPQLRMPFYRMAYGVFHLEDRAG